MAESLVPGGHRGTRAIQRLVEFAPSTGGLALWVHHADAEVDPVGKAPPVSTDGHTLCYASRFEGLPLAEQAGWVAHEVLHIALRHPQRYLELQAQIGDVDLPLFNLCADAIVNSSLSHLGWLQLAPGSVQLDVLLAKSLGQEQNVEAALLEWDVERLYRAIDDRRSGRRSGQKNAQEQQQSGGREDGQRATRARMLVSPSHADLKPDTQSQTAPEKQADEAREWSERLLRAHAGDGAFSMLRVLIADLPRSRMPWEQVLRVQLAHGLTPRPAISWSRPSRSYIANQGRAGAHRRMPWEPGFSGVKTVPRLVVVVDVSGSIADTLMERFAREVEGITRRLEAGLVLVIGDDRVQRVASFAAGRSDLRKITFNGGGGTDFTPLLEEADRHRPDIGVVLTDLDGPARFRPHWPVIWAVPEAHARAVAPFGRKLVLN